MVGIEHVAGIYLASPPAVGSPVIGIVVLAILVAAVAFDWSQEAWGNR